MRADSVDPDKTFVFICGLHRSGTSLLHRLLREQDGVTGFRDTGVSEDEGQHLQSVFRTAKAHGGPGRFGFDRAAHLTEASPLVTADNRDKLYREWSQYWDPGCNHRLEKSPPNLVRTRFLQAMFPNSRFIVLTRHPIAVSLATKKWSKTSIHSLLRHWHTCHQAFQNDRPHLRHVYELRYENLVRDPAEVLQRLSEFLRLPLRLPPGITVQDRNHDYFVRWTQLRTSLFTRIHRHYLVARHERAFRAFGYSLRQPEPPTESGSGSAASAAGGRE